MSAPASARLIYASRCNFIILTNFSSHVLKTYVPPKLNACFREGTSVRCMCKLSPKLCLSDTGDDSTEKEESKYLFQKLTRKENAARLVDCIGCTESVALSILRDHPRLKFLSSGEISKIMKLLNENGLRTETVSENYWLLAETTDSLSDKLAILAEMGIKNNDIAAPLLRFPTERLKKTSSWCKAEGYQGKNKLSYVCDRLECDPADVALAVSVHDFLLSVPFERMVEILDLLLGEGVPPAKILKDMWVFRYRTEKVLKRIQMARNGKVVQFKPWMVRCTEKILNDTIRVQAERREVYGPHNNSKVEYISNRLKLSREETEMILRRQPTLRVTGAAKLCNFLDFLYGKEGETERSPNFDPISVWSLSKILCHSLSTLKERHERLKALGYEAKHPIVLYQSKRKFEEFVRELKKAVAENSKQFEVYNSKVRKINASKNVNR